jgi:hypothetical protein
VIPEREVAVVSEPASLGFVTVSEGVWEFGGGGGVGVYTP